MTTRKLEQITEELRGSNWIKALQERGSIYIVGGTIRDAYQAKSMKDIDLIVENISMNDIKSLLKDFGKVDIVGESFAVVKFRPLGHVGEAFDIAIPRKDMKIGEGHKGFEVQTDGVSLLDDLKRRDFTINSIALDIRDNTIIDPFNGLDDLAAGLIKATDKSAFIDDPLRILRGIQFASRFGFEIESETLDLMKEYSSGVHNISGERIFDEFMKIVNKKGSVRHAFNLMKATDLDLTLFGWPMYSYAGNLNQLDEVSFFWTLAMLGDINAEHMLKNRLKANTKLIKDIAGLDQIFDSFRNRIENYTWGNEDDRLLLSGVLTKNPDLGKVKILQQEALVLITKMQSGILPRNMKDIQISGHDLMKRGIQGEKIGLINNQLLKDALMGRFNWKNREKCLTHLSNTLKTWIF